MINSSKKLTRTEFIAGFVFFAFHLLVLPSALLTLNQALPKPLSDSLLTCVFYLINFVAVTGIFHKFLKANLQAALRQPLKVLCYAALGLCIHFVGNTIITNINVLLYPAFANLNDLSISDMVRQNYGLMAIGTVILVPVAEETFYRGLIFRQLFTERPVAAYLVSMAVFSIIHIAGYAEMADFPILLLCFFQYLPSGFALAWAYHRSGTIFAPILIHSMVNLVGILITR